ncbi:MAG: TIR domain-containing protein [Alphaproteobacteria bacterium]|nr:TIR domain-containing protein [Alphaproteobacteria bacterium]
MTAAPDIFISYSSDDRARAKLFADAFAAAGLNVWWDAGLRAGDAYDQKIEQALRAARAVVVLWSPTSVASRWVRAEATLADRNRTLVPATIEPCEKPIMFELTQTADLSHWRGDLSDRAWLAFLDDVRRMAARAAPSASPAPSTTAEPPTVKETLKPGQSGSAPSLAVLPFTNRSGLAEDEVFAEGMVEDVISALSQGVNVRVLGSTATANLSRAAIMDIAALGRQLGVRYLLEGNIRRVGASLRVTTQLMEAETGAVMWTGKFDRALSELAELQEELVTDIAASLDTQVYSQEMERALKKPSDITAWEAVALSYAAWRRSDPAAIMRAIKEAKRAVAIAPDYGSGHAILAIALAGAYFFSTSPDDPAEVRRIRAIAEHALALAADDIRVLGDAGYALCFLGYPEEGERHIARALRKAPGNGWLHHQRGVALVMLNRPEAALSHLKTAERLMPGSPIMWAILTWQTGPNRELGRWAEAEALADESMDLNPTHVFNYVLKAVLCLQSGRQAEAFRQIATARRMGWDPGYTARLWCRAWPNSPRLSEDLALLQTLFAATEPAA